MADALNPSVCCFRVSPICRAPSAAPIGGGVQTIHLPAQTVFHVPRPGGGRIRRLNQPPHFLRQGLNGAGGIGFNPVGHRQKAFGLTAQKGFDLFHLEHGLTRGLGQVHGLASQGVGHRLHPGLAGLIRIGESLQMLMQGAGLAAKLGAAIEIDDEHPHHGERQEGARDESAELLGQELHQLLPPDRVGHIIPERRKPSDRQNKPQDARQLAGPANDGQRFAQGGFGQRIWIMGEYILWG